MMYKREQDLQRNLEGASERAAKQVQSLVSKSLFTKKINGKHNYCSTKPKSYPSTPSSPKSLEEERRRRSQILPTAATSPPPKKMELQHKNKGKRKTKSGNCDPNNTNPRGVELVQLLSSPKIRSTPKQKQQLQSSSSSAASSQKHNLEMGVMGPQLQQLAAHNTIEWYYEAGQKLQLQSWKRRK
jgi:hypothetical protein